MQLITIKDGKAFSELYDRYNQRMMQYFYRMLWQDKLKSEDFVQELFAKIIHKPELFDGSRSFKTWFYSVAHNMCKNEYKKQSIRAGTNETIPHNNFKGEDGGDYDFAVDYENFNSELMKCLERLEQHQKDTFLFRYKDDLSIKEISKIMECSEGTVKSRLFYTIKKLAPQLASYNPISI